MTSSELLTVLLRHCREHRITDIALANELKLSRTEFGNWRRSGEVRGKHTQKVVKWLTDHGVLPSRMEVIGGQSSRVIKNPCYTRERFDLLFDRLTQAQKKSIYQLMRAIVEQSPEQPEDDAESAGVPGELDLGM